MKRELVCESLRDFKHNVLNEREDLIPGGAGEGLDVSDVDPKEFLLGTAVEMEHTTEKPYAQEIALDHLAENPKYYSEMCEDGLVDEPLALNAYKKYFIDKEEISDEDVADLD